MISIALLGLQWVLHVILTQIQLLSFKFCFWSLLVLVYLINCLEIKRLILHSCLMHWRLLKLVKVTSKDTCFFLIIIEGCLFPLLLMLLFVAGNLFLVLRLFFIAESKGLIQNIKKSPHLYPLCHQGSLKKLPLHFCNIKGYFCCTVGLSTLNLE